MGCNPTCDLWGSRRGIVRRGCSSRTAALLDSCVGAWRWEGRRREVEVGLHPIPAGLSVGYDARLHGRVPCSNEFNDPTNILSTRKSITLILRSAALASSAIAGTTSTYSAKSGKGVAPFDLVGFDCFAPGFPVGVYGGGMFPRSGGDDVAGCGVLGEYFFT